MSDEKTKPPAPAAPPVLERVPAGYRPQGVRSAVGPPQAGAASPAQPPPQPPQASYGMRPRELGAEAAVAAGLAHQGSLSSESALYLFAVAAAMQASGRLTLTPEGRSYALTFRRGTVEHAASSDPEDDLGRFFVRKGALPAEALARAEARRGAFAGDLVSALIAERAVNPADVAALLQEHGSAVVTRALAVESGGWSWNPQATPPAGAFPLGPPFAMLCAAARALDATALMRRLGGREHRAAARGFGRIRFEDLRLTAQETRAAGLFDGARSPAEIAAASPAEALTVLRLAVLLGELGLLSFGASRKGPASAPPPAASARTPAPAPGPSPVPARPPAGPPAAVAPAPAAPAARPAPATVRPQAQPAQPAARPSVTPAPARPAVTPAPARPAVTPAPARPPAGPPDARPAAAPAPAAAKPPSLDRASLEALLARLAGADHFAALGVKQDAPAGQIKASYFQLAKAYHPDAVPADAEPQVKKLCADLFARVSEAWSVLGDDGSRAAYLEKLRSGGTAEVDVMNIFQAEELFQAGTMLVKARKYEEALRQFEQAMKLNADEAEFGMWKAWCEFLLAADRKKKLGPAAAAIEAGLKKNPRCAQGYLFLGQMAKIAGDLPLAEKQLRRGLQVAPDHGDLQRELKYLRK